MNISSQYARKVGGFGRRALKEGKIIIAGSADAVDCMVENLSDDGALISVPADVSIPDRFELDCEAANACRQARVVERTADYLIIRFCEREEPARDDRLAKSDAPGTLSAGMRSSAMRAVSANLVNFDKFMISPAFTFSVMPDPVFSTRGTCVVAVSLCNRSEITAHQPFLCLPVLGLKFEAAPGWIATDVTAFRRLRRFSRPGVHELPKDGEAHCCDILLPFSVENGCTLEFETGAWHALANLPDLRLTCITGAGNYPSERLPLIVPAAEIRAFFRTACKAGKIPQIEELSSTEETSAIV